MSETTNEDIRKNVRETYAKIVAPSDSGGGCCAPAPAPAFEAITEGCCGTPDVKTVSGALGYSAEELLAAPEGANLGLGCGNPQAIAALKKGETVIDLGSGAGFDVFLASRQVGDDGKVIGVDMTPDMLAKARENASKGGYENVEFRLGEIESLPVADNTADVIISNCVVNLSPDKQAVYSEAYRVLKPGGRVAISDVVLTAEMPEDMKNDPVLHSACISGAETIEKLTAMMEQAGFAKISIEPKAEIKEQIKKWVPDTDITDYITSANIEAVKPVSS